MLEFSKIAGRYAIERRLYSRGGASGYLARDERSSREPRVLELAPYSEHSAEAAQRIESYGDVVATLRGLDHPNLAGLRELVVDASYFGVAKIYEPGRTLESWLGDEAGESAASNLQLSLCRDVLEGLAAVHEMGVLHRQITTSNIWLAEGTARPVAQLDGFERAVLAPDGELVDADPLPAAAVHVAPEVRRGGVWSTRSDVYATGLVLLELLSGKTLDQALAARRGASGAPDADAAPLGQGEALDEDLVRSVVRAPFTEVVVRATRPYRVERFEDGLDLLAAFDAVDLDRRLGELAFLD